MRIGPKALVGLGLPAALRPHAPKKGVGGLALGAQTALNFVSSRFRNGIGAPIQTSASSVDGWTFTRSGSAFAMANGTSGTFATNVARILSGRLFLEAAANTNLDKPSQGALGLSAVNVTMATTTTVGPDGTTAFYTSVTSTSSGGYGQRNVTVANNSATYARSAFVLKTAASQTFRLLTGLAGGTPPAQGFVDVNLNTGAVVGGSGTVEDWTTCWRITTTITNNSTGNTTLFTWFMPVVGGTGVCEVGGLMLNVGTLAGSYIPTTSVAVTQNAETLTMTVPAGRYSTKTIDLTGETWTTAVDGSGGSLAITPRTGLTYLTQYYAYPLDFYDVFDRANTSAGTLGTSTSGSVWTLYGGYVGSYPLPAATDGQISSNAYVDAGGTVVYATTQLAQTVMHLEATWSWVDDGVGTDFTTLALIISSNANIIDNMLHITITNSTALLQKRVAGGSFVTLGTITISPTLELGGTRHVARVDVSGTTARLTVDSQSVTASDPDIPSVIGRFIGVEHYSATTSVRYPMTVYSVGAAYQPLAWPT